jgi:glycosyltransferase involved in cell wall biosynthesis
MQSNGASAQSPSDFVGVVLVVCPGGLERGGGIGRQMDYFLEARQARQSGLTYRIIDSRGPWFLGASPFHIFFAAFYLGGAALKLLAARFSAMPCIVHFNITGRGSTVRKIILVNLARAFGLRYLVHVHDYDYGEEYRRRGKVMKFLIATVFRGAERVLVLGAREENALSRLLRLPRRRITVLHNAVPDPRPDPATSLPRDQPLHILFLGHLSARKGVPELLRALASPALRDRNWRATLAGGGPIDEMRRLADELGIAERVSLPGWLDRTWIEALWSESDIFVLPSHAEGLAMAVLEGLSYGRVVVTTPVGAHLEVIEPDISGILIPPGDEVALAAALVRVIDDEDLRLRLSAGARRRFLEKFEVHGYAERLTQLHASLLFERGSVATVEQELRPR